MTKVKNIISTKTAFQHIALTLAELGSAQLKLVSLSVWTWTLPDISILTRKKYALATLYNISLTKWIKTSLQFIQL